VRALEREVRELQSCIEKCGRNFLLRTRQRLAALSEKTLGRELRQRLRESQQQIDLAKSGLLRGLQKRRDSERARLTKGAFALKAHHPARELAVRRNHLVESQRRLQTQMRTGLTNAQQHWERAAGMLRLLGPQATLERGYSITRDANGKLIRTKEAANAGARITTRVSDGEFESTVA
jgi:exodeoxyribonuclease VII large subunit